MSEDFNFDAAPAAPTLSFGAEEAKAVQEEPKAEAKNNGNIAMEAQLSAEELKQVEEFSKQIDISNSSGIMNYGVGTQKKLADFSEKALDNVKTKDMGEVGGMITDLVTQLKDFEIAEDEKGLKALFKRGANKFEAIKAKYSKVETNVQTISNELEKHQVTLMKDVEILDRMYELNLNYYKELSMYILAGKKKLEEERNTTLVDLQKKAAESGLPEDAEKAKDFASLCDRFEKKIYDLELTRTIARRFNEKFSPKNPIFPEPQAQHQVDLQILHAVDPCVDPVLFHLVPVHQFLKFLFLRYQLDHAVADLVMNAAGVGHPGEGRGLHVYLLLNTLNLPLFLFNLLRQVEKPVQRFLVHLSGHPLSVLRFVVFRVISSEHHRHLFAGAELSHELLIHRV